MPSSALTHHFFYQHPVNSNHPHLSHSVLPSINFSTMAAVHAPSLPSHPSPFRKAAITGHHLSRSRVGFHSVPSAAPPPPPSQVHAPQVHASSKTDPFFGHEYIARLCARFITHLFACPEYPPSATHSQAKLPYFIAYALHRTKLHSSVTFAALVLLQRLKARFPTARGSSGHRLFISAFMIASKVICDDTYSNKSWSIVAQGMFTLREINQMEREMCSYLEWELTVDNTILGNFEAMVKRDFRGSTGPYPTYSLQMVSKKIITSTAAANGNVGPPAGSSTSPIPSFGQRHPSPPKPVVPPPPGTGSSISSITTTSSHGHGHGKSHPHVQVHVPPHRSASTASTTSTTSTSSYGTPPATPDTPSTCSSSSSSPASTASPPTPPGIVDLSAQIVSTHTSVSPPAGLLSIRTEKPPVVHPLKGKMFAFALPSVW